MTPVLLGRFEVESPEWHAARANGIGGSEIAAILGLSKWQSHYSTWMHKKGAIPDQRVNAGMEWGTRLEPVIVAKWAENHPRLYVSQSTQHATWAAQERPWQIANPDWLCGPIEPLEIKTDRYADEWGPDGSDEVPPYYLVQLRWYMDVFDADTGHMAVLIGGSDYREYVIGQDLDDVKLMRGAGQAFMDSLAANEPPDIDSSTATYEAVRQLHPDIDDVSVEIDPDLAYDYLDTTRAEKDAAAAARHFKSRLLDAMGRARRATLDGRLIATRQPNGLHPPKLVPARGNLTGQPA